MSRTALVVIDMINAYDFPDAEKVVPSAEEAVPVIEELIGDHDGPVIYVNDNFGHWRSHRDELIEEALEGKHPELVKPIEPADDALFVIKARHSIFYQTPLEYLLEPGGRRHARPHRPGDRAVHPLLGARRLHPPLQGRASRPTRSRTSTRTWPMPRSR